jgi:hypothetical protein
MDPSHHLCGRQLTLRLHNRFLAMDPVRFNPVEPRTLGGQLAAHAADTARALGLFIVGAHPLPHLPPERPRSRVPDQPQRSLGFPLQLPATPGQELGREGRDWPPRNEAQPDLCGIRPQQALAGQGCGLRSLRVGGLCHQPQRLVFRPRLQGWLGQTRPPDFSGVAQHPLGGRGGKPAQPSARLFFRTYAGSGLVSQCLARFQLMPRRRRAVRTVSALTCWGASAPALRRLPLPRPASRLTGLCPKPAARGAGVLAACPLWRPPPAALSSAVAKTFAATTLRLPEQRPAAPCARSGPHSPSVGQSGGAGGPPHWPVKSGSGAG